MGMPRGNQFLFAFHGDLQGTHLTKAQKQSRLGLFRLAPEPCDGVGGGYAQWAKGQSMRTSSVIGHTHQAGRTRLGWKKQQIARYRNLLLGKPLYGLPSQRRRRRDRTAEGTQHLSPAHGQGGADSVECPSVAPLSHAYDPIR